MSDTSNAGPSAPASPTASLTALPEPTDPLLQERAELVAAWRADRQKESPPEMPFPAWESPLSLSGQPGLSVTCDGGCELVGDAPHPLVIDEPQTFEEWFGPPPCRAPSPCDEARLLSRLAALGRELPTCPLGDATSDVMDAYLSALRASEAGFGRLLGEVNLLAALEVDIGEKGTPEGRFAVEFVRQGVNVGRVLALKLRDRYAEGGMCFFEGEAEVYKIRLHRHQWEGDFARSVGTLGGMAEPERHLYLDAVAALIRAALTPKARHDTGTGTDRPKGEGAFPSDEIHTSSAQPNQSPAAGEPPTPTTTDENGDQPSNVTGGKPKRDPDVPQVPSRPNQEETSALVADWFKRNAAEVERNPKAVTRDRIATETGTHPPYVSRAPMWIAFSARKKAGASPRPREVALTDAILATVPGGDVMPEGLAELIDDQAEDKARDESYPERCNSRRKAP